MPKLSIKKINSMKKNKIGIACLTAYDASFAKLIDECGINIILVGDSLGQVIQASKNTHSVSMEDMLYHTKLVSKGRKNAYLIADMPINSYKKTTQAAVNARRFINECGAEMVKIETNMNNFDILSYLNDKDIPVCAHIGIRPQEIKSSAEYKKQGKTTKSKSCILNEAILAEQAGAKLLIVECIEENLAKEISLKLSIPVIGIASGKYCDGQILVSYDLFGISFNGIPKFIDKKYFKIQSIKKRLKKFIQNTQKLPKS